MRNGLVVLVLMVGTVALAQQPANPRQQPGASITLMFAPEQHDLDDGHYILWVNRIYMVGGLNDPVGWDHMDNDAKTVKPVAWHTGLKIHVNDLTNTGSFEARLKIPEGDLVLAIDKFNEFNPCQNGGIVGFLHLYGTDSGCGDNNWPKTFVFLAGWGIRPCDAERQAALRQLRNALHDHAGHPRPEDAARELPHGEQEAARRRGESGHAANRLLHPQSAAEPEEQAEPRGLHALLRHGGHVEVARRQGNDVRGLPLAPHESGRCWCSAASLLALRLRYRRLRPRIGL